MWTLNFNSASSTLCVFTKGLLKFIIWAFPLASLSPKWKPFPCLLSEQNCWLTGQTSVPSGPYPIDQIGGGHHTFILSNNVVLAAQTKFLPTISDPLYPEALTAQLSASLWTSLELPQVVLEGDSSLVVATLPSVEQDVPSAILNTISNCISDLLSTVKSWSARKLPWESNSLAHELVQWAVIHNFHDHIPHSSFRNIWKFGGFDPP